jgi:hypothetical protein
VRWWILLALFVLATALWVVSLGDHVFWLRAMHTVITLRGGEIDWVGPRPYVFTYQLSRPVVGSVLLTIGVALAPLLRKPLGLALLTLLVHIVGCCGETNPFCGLAALVFDFVLFLRWRQWKRERAVRDPRYCIVCGYDLCATPERCPECGTAAWTLGPPSNIALPPGSPPLQSDKPTDETV